jgi:murein DD-endopeptidase MepM/ murein hydrolase activator NlpD
VTKKPFGIFITPEDSPVSPEKFTGYHTGTDFELFDDEETIDVTAICDGNVLYKKWVKGYGGVLIQNCMIDEEDVTVLYGHLALSSLTNNDHLLRGEKIGTLGKGFTEETDGERPHLHLAVHRGPEIELKGYVDTEEKLTNWIDARTILVK